jgi:hypothetical protein
MDERAVQWSSDIVQAKLLSIDPEVKLAGEVREFRGPIGALGSAVTAYYYRLYQFEVTRTLDGSLKTGEKFPVIRLFSRTQEPPLSCAQHLTDAGVGKEFILLVRPFSQFKTIVPTGVVPPKVAGAMWIVHLEPSETSSPSALKELITTIEGARTAEQQATPQRIDHLISQVESAPTDAQAGPSIRALQRIGPKVLPSVDKALAGTRDATRQGRLQQVVHDVTPTEPILMIEAQKSEPEDRHR